jgi:DNA uptake protein ComE-like DNA-binding protein
MLKRLLLGVVALGLGGGAWLLSAPAKPVPHAEPMTDMASADRAPRAAERHEIEPKANSRPFRVVYDGISSVKQGAMNPAPPAVARTVVQPETATSPTSHVLPDSAANAASDSRIGPISVPPAIAQPAADAPRTVVAQKININKASVDELNRLAGVGRIGVAIASHRPYGSVADLLTKRVVRKSVYEKIRAQLAAE